MIRNLMVKAVMCAVVAAGVVSAATVDTATMYHPKAGNPARADSMWVNFKYLADRVNALEVSNAITVASLNARCDSLSRDVTPVGAIIASYTAPVRGYMPNTGNKWFVCNGNAGTPVNGIAIPDLRGVFLRGLNVVNGQERSDSLADVETGRSVGSVQRDAFQGHYHPFGTDEGVVSQGSNGVGTNHTQYAHGNGTAQGTTQPNLSVPESDNIHGTPRVTTETRPKNIAVYYYIKVK